MTFNDTISQLRQYAIKKGIDYSLDRLTPIFARYGDPHLNCPPVIHVAGTNGKGSVVAFAKSILMEAGYSVGTFTSPHLNCYTERMPLTKPLFPLMISVHYLKNLKKVIKTV